LVNFARRASYQGTASAVLLNSVNKIAALAAGAAYGKRLNPQTYSSLVGYA
jgi:hypothetical protein